MAPVSIPLDGLVRTGRYAHVLASEAARPLIEAFVRSLGSSSSDESNQTPSQDSMTSSAVGLAAFDAFLQTNVTGPVLEGAETVERVFASFADGTLAQLRRACFASLDVDGVSAYPYIPRIELFALARHLISNLSDHEWSDPLAGGTRGTSLPWMKLRVHVWHYKLFIQPSLSAGNAFNKSGGWSEVPTLVEVIQQYMDAVEKDVIAQGTRWRVDDKVRFLVEKANVYIMLGLDLQARDAFKAATDLHGFAYALSGALGKRTRFQEKNTSQLVVLAKSGNAPTTQNGGSKKKQDVPTALPLNNDTLLEDIEYAKPGDDGLHGEKNAGASELPTLLADLAPDDQPQLSPLDQIILLTEATWKDAFSPTDSLTSEEMLPFAVRVINDKSTNWQIYTQALLVRSRIEVHRSRTMERGVLQMQVVVDQVVVDTTKEAETDAQEVDKTKAQPGVDADVPAIQVSIPDEEEEESTPRKDRQAAAPVSDKPTSFFPVAKPTESAPAHVRLGYIHALSSPPRWHLESELAYAWTGVGSLVSALEIFKRLKLWAEVALCLASSASVDDEDGSGRGSGGEEKARAIIRWRLFHRGGERPTGITAESDDDIDENIDISTLKAAEFTGPERIPPQPNAPRLFCILGEIEPDSAVAHYERAWEISQHRYARAQKSLGEDYIRQREWEKARQAYKKAVSVNRLSSEMWDRLGDINLRLGQFADAAEAFSRAIGAAGTGEDARTWSNLGSSLYSLYCETIEENKKAKDGDDEEATPARTKLDDEEDDDAEAGLTPKKKVAKDASALLSQSMNAYKRGASLAHDNWRIWDNVITLAARIRPIPFSEIILALRAVIRIRNTEEAVDHDILRLLLTEAVLTQDKKDDTGSGVYEPQRGSVEKNVDILLEQDIAPLITNRSELWELVSRLRAWRRDYTGAIDASEKAWRAAVGGASVSSSLGGGSSTLSTDAASRNAREAAASRNWLENKEAWKTVVDRTDELVAVLENFGPRTEELETKWKGKARSAVRSVMGKAKEAWEGSDGWETLKGLLEGLKA